MQIKGQNGDKEATDACWSQTGEGPSKMLKRGPKHDLLQFMIKPKTMHKHAQNTMQDKAKKRASTQSIQKMPQTGKYPQ